MQDVSCQTGNTNERIKKTVGDHVSCVTKAPIHLYTHNMPKLQTRGKEELRNPHAAVQMHAIMPHKRVHVVVRQQNDNGTKHFF